jgi:hypothetical protein
MQRTGIVRGGYAFVLTPRGALDWRNAETCECRPRVNGGFIECPECGTVYGLLRDQVERGSMGSREKRA